MTAKERAPKGPWVTTPWTVALAIVVAAFLVGGYFVRRSVMSAFDEQQQIGAAQGALFESIEGQLDEETGVRGYAATGDPSLLEPYETAKPILPATLANLVARLRAMGLADASDAAADAAIVNKEWLSEVALPTVSNSHRNDVALQRNGKQFIDQFREDAKIVGDALAGQSQRVNATT